MEKTDELFPKDEDIIENEEIHLSVAEDKPERKPFLLCLLIVKHPYLWFGTGFCVHLSFLLFTVLSYFLDWVVVFNFAFDDIPLIDTKYEPYHCYRSWDVLRSSSFDYSIMMTYDREKFSIDVRLYYESKSDDNDILFVKSLKSIQKLEQKLINFLTENTTCDPVTNPCIEVKSIINLLLEVDPTDSDFQRVSSTLDLILLNSSLKARFQTMVSRDFQPAAGGSSHRAKAVRTDLFILRTSQYFNMAQYLSKLRYEFRSHWEFYYENKMFIGQMLLDQINTDSLLILGSVVFIYSFTLIQTRSLFVTFFAVTSIFSSFFIANLIHTVVLRIKFFGVFHVLSIFLILGFGCDNIYVFFDRWKSLQSVEYDSLAVRLTDTYIGVGWSMFITSITTAMAFYILTMTPLLTIYSFGTFVTMLVLVNYVSVLIYFPSIIIVFQLRFANVGSVDNVLIFFTRLFEVHYFNLLSWKYVRYGVLLGFMAIAVIATGSLFQLRISEQFPDLMVASTMLGRLEKLKTQYFMMKHIDNNIEIIIVFGVKNLDFSDCKFWDYKCKPNITVDKDFQINRVEMQNGYQRICNEIINANETIREKLALFNDSKNNVNCITIDMDKYFINRFPKDSLIIPWTETNYIQLLTNNQGVYRNRTPDGQFPYKFETAMYFFLTDGYTFSAVGYHNFKIYKKLQFCTIVVYKSNHSGKQDLILGHHMNFSAIRIKITLFETMSGFTKKKTVFNSWIKWNNDKRTANPKLFSLVCGSQSDLSMNGHFHWIHVQESLNSAALKGVIFGLVVSIPIIFCATRNIYTFFAIMLGTSLSTLTVVGIIPIVGWQLGLLESINITVVVGLTIDYLVHMGLAFNKSVKETKEERTQDMLAEMGVSIISSMLTTLGSAFFLFFCKVKFLFQFGIFVFVTIFSAGIYSMIFLPCWLLVFGPARHKGDLKRICRRGEAN